MRDDFFGWYNKLLLRCTTSKNTLDKGRMNSLPASDSAFIKLDKHLNIQVTNSFNGEVFMVYQDGGTQYYRRMD